MAVLPFVTEKMKSQIPRVSSPSLPFHVVFLHVKLHSVNEKRMKKKRWRL